MTKKILLCCAAGMSTSLLVTKMKQDAAARNLDVEIEALPINEGLDKVDQVDVVLLGPQVGYVKDNFEKVAAGKIDVMVIPMADYGRMNAKKINDEAMAHMK